MVLDTWGRIRVERFSFVSSLTSFILCSLIGNGSDLTWHLSLHTHAFIRGSAQQTSCKSRMMGNAFSKGKTRASERMNRKTVRDAPMARVNQIHIEVPHNKLFKDDY